MTSFCRGWHDHRQDDALLCIEGSVLVIEGAKATIFHHKSTTSNVGDAEGTRANVHRKWKVHKVVYLYVVVAPTISSS